MNIFFNPTSIAVIGARKRKGGYQIIKNLQYGFQGEIYPVNPNYDQIEGLPCFCSVEDIPGKVDMAIILVPASATPAVLETCARKNVLRVMIQSAGFSEVGKEGKGIQTRCTAIAKEAGMRIWGPNCMGMVDVINKRYFTFMNPRLYKDGLMPGRISMVVQSGMLSGVFIAELSRLAIGVGKVCSIGNKADVDECDLLEYLLADLETDVLAFYLESIGRARRFAEIAGRASKPIVLLKGGKSDAGARAALSHTASLSGDSRLLESVLQASGVILANDFHQMIDLSRTLIAMPEEDSSYRTAILTFSGGAGILTCDLLEKHNLPVAKISKKTKTILADIFPKWMPVDNPVDLYPAVELSGRQKTYNRAIGAVLDDSRADVIIVHHVAGLDDENPDLDALKKKADRVGKLVLFWLVGRRDAVESFRKEAQARGIQIFGETSRAVECLAAAAYYYRRKKSRGKIRDTILLPSRHGLKAYLSSSVENRVWDEYDSKRLLAAWHIPIVTEKLISTSAQARQFARDFGYPLVFKGLISGEVHKTEAGLIRLGVNDRQELENTWEEFKKKLEGKKGRILLQQEVKRDYELIAGFVRNDQLGTCVMFGMGGIFSELDPDVVFTLAPLKQADALRLIDRVRSKKLLEGFRGMKPLEKKQMAEILVHLGNLGASYSRIEQIDINPIVVRDGHPLAVDATVILNSDRL